MVKPFQRSNSLARRDVVSPKGRHLIHFVRRHNKLPHCGVCGKELNGVGYKTSGGKTRMRPERIFGGVLCHECVSEVLKYTSRVEQKEMKIDDIPIKYRGYVLQLFPH
ncbi:MAG: 50S ribosomal protein L34e [Candidatus Micrarchaeota archaeon]|nr:MAG: 50S ribosomal protein L34e [Candidatus Micrarchaeota archaeon]